MENDIMSNSRISRKDKLIDNIDKAVKHVHEYKFCSHVDQSQEVVLRNDDWQFQKLVESLDDVFLHGLINFQKGYWALVKEFTHKTTILEINKYQKVTTDIGRSRAWLYSAISDHLLESYVECFMENSKYVRKFYQADAVMVDEEKLHTMRTLSSGLDQIGFELELDVPYLDLASYYKNNRCKLDDENGVETTSGFKSLPSMLIRSQLATSILNTFHPSLIMEPGLAKPTLKDVFKEEPNNVTLDTKSEDVKDANHVESLKRLQVLPLASVDSDQGRFPESEIEVTRFRPKRSKRKVHSDSVSLCSVNSIQSPESGYDEESMTSLPPTVGFVPPTCSHVNPNITTTSHHENPTQNLDAIFTLPLTTCHESSSHNLAQTTREDPTTVIIESLSSEDVSTKLRISSSEVTLSKLENPSLCSVIKKNSSSFSTLKKVEFASPEHPADQSSRFVIDGNGDRLTENELLQQIFEDGILRSTQENEQQELEACQIVSATPSSLSSTPPKSCDEMKEMCEVENSDEDKSSKEKSSLPEEKEAIRVEAIRVEAIRVGLIERESDLPSIYDFQASNNISTSSVEVPTHHADPAAVSSSTSPTADHEINSISRSRSVQESSTASSKLAPRKAFSLSWDENNVTDAHEYEMVDNNFKLVMMDEIFQFNGERLLKVYRTSQDHCEGHIKRTFLVISSEALYLVIKPNHSTKRNHLMAEAVVSYKELDFISLGIDCQMIHITCKNRRNQYWVTTGEKQLTRIIVGHINRAVLDYSAESTSLEIDTDATVQRIAMQKALADECKFTMHDVKILSYSLVFWENTSAISSGPLKARCTRSGFLSVKTYSTNLWGVHSWSPSYFRIVDGNLLQYTDQVSMAVKATYSLNSQFCSGCRRCTEPDRSYCFELKQIKGTSVVLSASNKKDVEMWIQSLCQAMSSQMGNPASSLACLACCCVLTQNKLFMCHEDLWTNFVRTIGSVALTELTSLLCDTDPSVAYCILTYMPTVKGSSEEKWAIYFNSVAEKNRFVKILSEVCAEYTGRELITAKIGRFLSERCREGIKVIEKMVRPGVTWQST